MVTFWNVWKITGVNPYIEPMMIYPAVHYTMEVYGLIIILRRIFRSFATGECNFSDHGANRLGASALYAGIGGWIFCTRHIQLVIFKRYLYPLQINTNQEAFEEAERNVREQLQKLLAIKGKQTVEDLHKKLVKSCGNIWYVAMPLDWTARTMIRELRDEFWRDVHVPGSIDEFNPELEKAMRVADFIELGELMVVDALNRTESCGGHFRKNIRPKKVKPFCDDEKLCFTPHPGFGQI